MGQARSDRRKSTGSSRSFRQQCGARKAAATRKNNPTQYKGGKKR